MNILNNSYFKNMNFDDIKDSLTKTINKKYISEYINYLFEKKIVFSLTIMDVDNFKNVNDSYGHNVGDMVLADVGQALVDCCTDGVVGRFGGDEFVLIKEGINSYKDSYNFISNIVVKSPALRKIKNYRGNSIFVTATSGTASFPKDASSYDELMFKIDQALYKGKVKGRNCYVVYMEEKHSNLDSKISFKQNTMNSFSVIDALFSDDKSLDKIYEDIAEYIEKAFNLKTMFLDKDGSYFEDKAISKLIDFVSNKSFDSVINSNGYAAMYRIDEYGALNPVFKKAVTEQNLYSAIVSKVEARGTLYGYFIILDTRRTRLWNDNEIVISHYIAKSLAFELLKRGATLVK